MKKYLIIFVLIAACLYKLYADNPMNRQQVVANAAAHVNIGEWTASTNTYTFAPGKIFQSKYSVGVKYTKFNWPYVYGGREDDRTTISRIKDKKTCPGGASASRLNTKKIYDDGFCPANHLAGIDCVGFIMEMINITDQNMLIKTNASKFKSTYCLPVDPQKLQLGDVLVSPKHIKMVTGVSPLEVTEANGTPGLQRVTTQKADIGAYGIYTPFPIFPSITPGAKDTVGPTPTINVTIKSCTNIDNDNVYMEIDGDKVAPVITSYSKATKQMTLSYTPSADNALAAGDHQIYVYVENDLSLADDITSSFNVKEDTAAWSGNIKGVVVIKKYIDGKEVSFEHSFSMKLKFIDDIDINKLKKGAISQNAFVANENDIKAKIQEAQASGKAIDPAQLMKELQSNAVMSRMVAGRCEMILDVPDENTHVEKQTGFGFNIIDKLVLMIGDINSLSAAMQGVNTDNEDIIVESLLYSGFIVNVVDDNTILVNSSISEDNEKNTNASNYITGVSGQLTRILNK